MSPLVTGDTRSTSPRLVQVIRGGVNVVGTVGGSVNYTGDTAVITGVKDDDIIRYSTDADHNRVLIRNDQPASGSGSNVSFDLGGFTLTEVAGDTDEVGSNIFFEDDGPSITTGTNPTALTVDETTLGTDASGSFASQFNVAFGTDGPGTDGVRAGRLWPMRSASAWSAPTAGWSTAPPAIRCSCSCRAAGHDHRQGGDQPGRCRDG